MHLTKPECNENYHIKSAPIKKIRRVLKAPGNPKQWKFLMTAFRPDEILSASRILEMPLDELIGRAAELNKIGHGNIQTWSPKVFIPLTRLCRDYCHYCTFSRPPKIGEIAYLKPSEIMEIAIAGKKAGCTEALFTLGDKPELRFANARKELDELGYATTIEYLIDMCEAVRDQTGLLPHVNAGIMSTAEMAALKNVSASQGLMMESTAERLCAKGMPHYQSPDKIPSVRLEMLRAAGELKIPFTTGILIGIGETRAERIEALEAIRDLHSQYGHIQEVIVQNFRAKPGTPMANAPEPDLDDLLWTIAIARIILGPNMNIQAPPNLSDLNFGRLIDAGINDWGGISPVTPDHVNPERPWPQIEILEKVTSQHGRNLVPRLPIYPEYLAAVDVWLAPDMKPAIISHRDAEGYGRADKWSPGLKIENGFGLAKSQSGNPDKAIYALLEKAKAGHDLDEAEIVTLFSARSIDVERICETANDIRKQVNGETITYAVNRNINYTNVCSYKCGFCAFSKGNTSDELRGKPYDLDHSEIARRTIEAWERGATEVCLQGGIHPKYDGETYKKIAQIVKSAVPSMHVHAFSPLEISHGASSLGISVKSFLGQLKSAGLDTLPGTAAEILDDEIRDILCPDKLSTQEWLDIVRTAHLQGLRTTATIMFGHVEKPVHWARHLIHIRELQKQTGGFTEFVPLPFVHMEAPISLRGKTRNGPTLREVRLMHAISRIVLHPYIKSIQTSWVKLGTEGVKICLNGGANDLGGTLMNESISRAAGTEHGQEFPPEAMIELIKSIGRIPQQRTTNYGPVSEADHQRSLNAQPLEALIQTPLKTRQHNNVQESKNYEFTK